MLNLGALFCLAIQDFFATVCCLPVSALAPVCAGRGVPPVRQSRSHHYCFASAFFVGSPSISSSAADSSSVFAVVTKVMSIPRVFSISS